MPRALPEDGIEVVRASPDARHITLIIECFMIPYCIRDGRKGGYVIEERDPRKLWNRSLECELPPAIRHRGRKRALQIFYRHLKDEERRSERLAEDQRQLALF